MHTKPHYSYIQSVITITSNTMLQESIQQDHKDSVGSKTHISQVYTALHLLVQNFIYQLANIYVKKLNHFQEMYLAKKEKKIYNEKL